MITEQSRPASGFVNAALERRFQPVTVPEPSVEDAVQILAGLADRYAEHHQVRYTDEALRAAVVLSDRHITDRFLPDKKAIDLIRPGHGCR